MIVLTTLPLMEVWLKSLEWDKSTNSYIKVNTRELNRDFFNYYRWSVLTTVHPTLNNHV